MSEADDASTQKLRPRTNTRWREKFLESLALSSNVSSSARFAGVSETKAYRARRADASFSKAWYTALCEGYVHLEMEVLRRLREGDLLTSDGAKFDFANAQRILSAHKESVAPHKAQNGYDDEDAILDAINAKLDSIRQRKDALVEEP